MSDYLKIAEIASKSLERWDTQAPPKREWIGLTDEERFGEHTKYLTRNEWALVIEAKLKEKNS